DARRARPLRRGARMEALRRRSRQPRQRPHSLRIAAVLRRASRQVRGLDMKALIATALLALPLMLGNATPAVAQNITAPPPPVPEGITVEEIKVHGASLEGNLEGNEVDRQVMVVLPPSYKSNPNKRYPV